MDKHENSAALVEQLQTVLLQKDQHILTLEQQNAELNSRLKWYEEQLRLINQKRFGSSSEKSSPEQLNLFNEAEESANPHTEEPQTETITYRRI